MEEGREAEKGGRVEGRKKERDQYDRTLNNKNTRWAHGVRVTCKSLYFPQYRIALLMSKLKKWYIQKLSFSVKYVKYMFP